MSGVSSADVATGLSARPAARAGTLMVYALHLAHGYAQANLVIPPLAFAADCHRFFLLISRPLRSTEMSDPGDPHIPALGVDLGVGTDGPCYMACQHGELIASPMSVTQEWGDDHVASAIGCSLLVGETPNSRFSKKFQ